MNINKQLIHTFFKSFQQLDYATMNSCYNNEIVFYDPVFGILKDDEVKCMWEMLCKNAKDFSLTYGNIIELDDAYITCDWVATYTYAKTGKTIINKIRANMLVEGGKIVEHSDAFSIHNWTKQAYGLYGLFFGWNSLFQSRIKNQAKKNLIKFMNSKG